MPLPKGVKYRVTHTAKGPIRLAFDKNGKVIEAKNVRTGDTHSPSEFAAEKKGRKGT